MIFRHSNFNHEFDFGYFGKIVIENPKFYREFIGDLFIDRAESHFSFNQNGKILDSNSYDFIFNPCCLDFDNKKIISSLIKKLTASAMSEDFYLSINQDIASTQKLLTDVIYANQCSFDISLSEPSAEALIKIFEPKIDVAETDFMNILYKYLEVMTDLANVKLFVFIGLGTFLDSQELQDLASFCENHEISILHLESYDFPSGFSYPKLIIDEDFCLI